MSVRGAFRRAKHNACISSAKQQQGSRISIAKSQQNPPGPAHARAKVQQKQCGHLVTMANKQGYTPMSGMNGDRHHTPKGDASDIGVHCINGMISLSNPKGEHNQMGICDAKHPGCDQNGHEKEVEPTYQECRVTVAAKKFIYDKAVCKNGMVDINWNRYVPCSEACRELGIGRACSCDMNGREEIPWVNEEEV